MTNFETDFLMKMRVGNSLSQSFGKMDVVAPIGVIINHVGFKEQIPDPGSTNVIVVGDNLQ